MNKQPNDSINQELKQPGDSEKIFNPLDPLGLLRNQFVEEECLCKIGYVRNDEGRVIGVDVVCDTPEARSEMALAMSGFMVRVRVKEELLPGETPGVSRP